MEDEKRLEHGKIYVRLKNEPGKSSPKPGVCLSLWDSIESDTDSLVQERAYQFELQKQIGGSAEQSMTQSQEEDKEKLCLNREDGKEEEQDEGELRIFDSLDVTAHRQSKKNDGPSPIKVHLQHRDKQFSRQIDYDDIYAELRYDPNWRINHERARQFDKMTSQLPLLDESHSSDEQSKRHVEIRKDLSGREGYRYITAHSPETTQSKFQSKHPLMSYHLHPKQNQATREVSPASSYPLHLHQNKVVGESMSESTCQSPGLPSETTVDTDSHQRVKADRGVRNQNNVIGDESQGSSPDLEEHYRESHERYDREFQIHRNQEQYGQSSGTATEEPSQNLTPSRSKGLQHLSNRKPEKPREDIIERNRVTLGISAAKQGSYLRAHAQQKELKTHGSNQVSASTEEIIGSQEEESQGDNLAPEMRLHQKTQQLQVTQISKKEKTVKRRENPKPPSEKRPLAQVGKARPTDSYLTDNPGPAARTQPHPHQQPQHSPNIQALSDTDPQCSILDNRPCPRQSQPFSLTQPPSVHLNINHNTSSKFLPFLHRNHKEGVLTSPSPFSGPGPQWNSQNMDASTTLRNAVLINPNSHLSPHPFSQDVSVEPVWTPQADGSAPNPVWGSHCRQGFPGISPLSQEPPNLRNQKNTPWQPENHMLYEDGDSHRSTYAAQIKNNPGSYTLLPPIGETTLGDPTLFSDRGAQRFTCMKRSISDGYLAQMLTEKQLKQTVTYKAYTLKDYKQLMQDMKLGGLGPDYATAEMTGEKIRRQKLYSNVIREQNKKINRIPSLPAARNPVGSNNKDNMVPRRKALEYARNILRPKVAPQLKQPKPRETEKTQEGDKSHICLLEGFTPSQLATLESLRKRHEQEKEIVARFKMVHTT